MQRLTLEELMQKHQQTKKVAVDPGLEKRVCCLCRGVYRDVDNHDAACSWHTGRRYVRACQCLRGVTRLLQLLERRAVVMLRQQVCFANVCSCLPWSLPPHFCTHYNLT